MFKTACIIASAATISALNLNAVPHDATKHHDGHNDSGCKSGEDKDGRFGLCVGDSDCTHPNNFCKGKNVACYHPTKTCEKFTDNSDEDENKDDHHEDGTHEEHKEEDHHHEDGTHEEHEEEDHHHDDGSEEHKDHHHDGSEEAHEDHDDHHHGEHEDHDHHHDEAAEADKDHHHDDHHEEHKDHHHDDTEKAHDHDHHHDETEEAHDHGHPTPEHHNDDEDHHEEEDEHEPELHQAVCFGNLNGQQDKKALDQGFDQFDTNKDGKMDVTGSEGRVVEKVMNDALGLQSIMDEKDEGEIVKIVQKNADKTGKMDQDQFFSMINGVISYINDKTGACKNGAQADHTWQEKIGKDIQEDMKKKANKSKK